jgi:hypothetical protein
MDEKRCNEHRHHRFFATGVDMWCGAIWVRLVEPKYEKQGVNKYMYESHA